MRIAVYGANGYQGKLVLAELARHGIDTVAVGRSLDRVRTAIDTIRGASIEPRVADLADPARLRAAFDDCDAVINCAGPFTSSGDAVARAAIAARCHYVDTSGEQLHIKHIFDALTTQAEAAGVTVVPAVTDGCVPGDLVAHVLAEHLEVIDTITVAHRIVGGGMSRGSLRSALATVEVLTSGGLSYADGEWRHDIPTPHTSMTFPGSSELVPVVKLPAQAVVTVPRHVRVRRVDGLAEADLSGHFAAVEPDLIDNLPEGPTEDSRRDQRFTVVIDATDGNGSSARGVIVGPDEYGTTALIAVEGARRLATDSAKPGVLTPAQAFQPHDFLAFLTHHGVTWTVDSGQ
jgi:short subunit dehydrogenase-like uncharacterized protein